MEQPRLKPTIIVPDAAPLIHLAAGNALAVINGMGRVIVPDIIALETTYRIEKPFAREIAAWIAEGQTRGSNHPVEIVQTEIGALYRLALDQQLTPPRDAGEIGIAAWLADNLADIGGPALVVYENGRVPRMLNREGVSAVVAVATTRNMLAMAEAEGIIPDSEAVWCRIVAKAPTANQASTITFIHPVAP